MTLSPASILSRVKKSRIFFIEFRGLSVKLNLFYKTNVSIVNSSSIPT